MSIRELESLILGGISGARFIFKESETSSFIRKVNQYKEYFQNTNPDKFTLIIDLPGTKPRIGHLETPITLKKGMSLNFSIFNHSEIKISNLDRQQFYKIKVGHKLSIADDSIELKVISRNAKYFQCESLTTNGILRGGRSIVFPDSGIVNSALSVQDIKLLKSLKSNKFDFKIAVSFCHSPKVIQTLVKNYKIKIENIIPKIETVMSKEKLIAIIKNCEYAILGRGDLSVAHLGYEWFSFQLLFINTCLDYKVEPVIGTGLFPSLSQSNRPKISEISDAGFLIQMGVKSFLIADDVSFTNPSQVVKQFQDLYNSLN